MLPLSFTTLGCPGWTLRQIVENAAAMGYDAIDFRGLLDTLDITASTEFTTDLAATKRLIADHGLAVSGIATSARYAVVDAEDLQRNLDETRRNLALAAELGAPVLRVYGGRVPEGHTVESILPTVVENLRRIGDEAEGYGVTLALETHDDWTDSTVFARLMREAAHPRVRVLWDLHHPYRTNGEPAALTYANLGPIHGQHARQGLRADARRRAPVRSPWRGRCPPKEMLDLLVAGGYKGYAILEWEKRWIPSLLEPEVVFPQYVAKMREWLGSAR